MTNQKKQPQIGVGVMIMRDGKLLLGQRKSSLGQSTYAWTGGHLEFGETLEECAKRETFEETRLVVTSLKFLCMSNVISYDKHYLDVEFVAEVESGEPQIMEPDKIVSWRWYELDDLPSPLFKAAELALQSYRTGQFYNP
ncbi:NUDIX domain-containing protein [Anaerolineales bacterium HSG24]|nr:NUDIX domain-containing protein [Anaerolineales bacterium HSG24]